MLAYYRKYRPWMVSFGLFLILLACSKGTFTVTPQSGPHGSISPSTVQSVGYSKIASFTITPDFGYNIESVSGCGGTLSGNIFTTGTINANCIVLATFVVAEIDAERLFSEYSKSVVVLEVFDEDHIQTGLGSGFIVSHDGLIATNFHVLRGSKYVKIRQGNQIFTLERLVDFDEDNDLALLKVEDSDLRAVKLGDLDKASVGEKVFVIGSPQGLQNTISDGIISNIRRTRSGKTFVQITAPISPGSSGGPVFNKRGEVIGVATFLLKDGQNLNFAVSVNALENMIAANSTPIPAESRPVSTNPENELPAFVDRFCKTLETKDVALILSYYADQVDYFEKGTVDKQFVQKDKENYFKNWTVVKNRIDGVPEVAARPDPNVRIVQFQSEFVIKGQRKLITGKANNTLILRYVDNNWKIIGEKQRILQLDKKDIKRPN